MLVHRHQSPNVILYMSSYAALTCNGKQSLWCQVNTAWPPPSIVKRYIVYEFVYSVDLSNHFTVWITEQFPVNSNLGNWNVLYLHAPYSHEGYTNISVGGFNYKRKNQRPSLASDQFLLDKPRQYLTSSLPPRRLMIPISRQEASCHQSLLFREVSLICKEKKWKQSLLWSATLHQGPWRHLTSSLWWNNDTNVPIIIPVSRWKELCHQSIIYFGKCHSAPRSVAASDQVPMGKQCHQRTDNTTSLSLGRILSPMSIYFGKCHSSPRSLAASDQIPLGKQCHQRTDNNTSLSLGRIMSPQFIYLWEMPLIYDTKLYLSWEVPFCTKIPGGIWPGPYGQPMSPTQLPVSRWEVSCHQGLSTLGNALNQPHYINNTF